MSRFIRTILTSEYSSFLDAREKEKMGKGLRSKNRIGWFYKRKGDLQKRKKADDDGVDETNEENEISWEVPKDLENIVEEVVADLETETVSNTKVTALYIYLYIVMYP